MLQKLKLINLLLYNPKILIIINITKKNQANR